MYLLHWKEKVQILQSGQARSSGKMTQGEKDASAMKFFENQREGKM